MKKGLIILMLVLSVSLSDNGKVIATEKPISLDISTLKNVLSSIKGVVSHFSVTSIVGEKAPPAAPTVEEITNRSFTIKGKTEADTTVIVDLNGKNLRKVPSSSTGEFIIGIPLQQPGAAFDFYTQDRKNNISEKVRIIVKKQERPSKVILDTPSINQFPELPRGCEVTSLAMLLQFAGINANKLTLAQEIKKDTTPLTFKKGIKYFGNPHVGFVGDMHSFQKPGLGVYHEPIAELAERYFPGRIVNLSGQSFESVLNYVSAGHPVWVIAPITYNYLPNSHWETWQTAQGPIRITNKEHSVLITGYDQLYIYFNDPYDGMKNKKKPMKPFIEGWKQFENQAISYF
jgi:uncharacterized protein YvpB